jgi:hypothetical protein
VNPEAVLTDADGRARTAWTLGELPGRQTLLASVEQVDSALAVVAEAEPLGSNTRVAPLAESPMAGAGQALAAVAGVRVTDSTGRALVGVPVSWVALDGAAQAVDARTDSLGEARVKWTLGPRAGRQRLRVQVGSGRGEDAVAPLTLTADALAGAPAALTVTSGDAQRGVAGAPLPRPVVIRVVDAAKNGVAGLSLSLAPTAGAVADTVAQTDSTGTARIQWTLGRSMGEQTLAVRVAGIPKPLRVTARAVPGAAANVAFDDADGAKGAHKLVALVTDEYGNPVPNARLRLSASSGSVSPERAVSDAQGRVTVTWRPGSRGGEQTLTARVVGGVAKGEFVTQAATALPAARSAPAKPAPTAKAAKPNLTKPAPKGAKTAPKRGA